MSKVEDFKTKSITHQEIGGYRSLRRKIVLGPKTYVTINKKGWKREYVGESVSLHIGIGNDHTATMVMSREAWEALVDERNEILVTTIQEFRKQVL